MMKFIKLLNLPISIIHSCIRILSPIKNINILSSEETINQICQKRLSVSRFGDGELYIIQGRDIGFQEYTPELAERLTEAIKALSKTHIVCIPYSLVDVQPYVITAQIFWKYSFIKSQKKWNSLLSLDKIYGDSLFTRFYIDMRDKTRIEETVKLLKKIWEKRDLLIAEGVRSKLGVGNNLFENANSIRRILCPAENSYSYYNSILSAIQLYNKKLLVLIALGPTATVLAYDLHAIGYQAIDIGHIDIEYEWYLQKANSKIPIQGKYVNECHAKGTSISDEVYESQIDIVI